MVPDWPGRSRGLHGLAGLDRLDGLGAERAADLAVTPDPRREHQAVNHGVAIKGQPGLFASHLDPDGFACLTLGLDRVQAHRPDRHAVPRGRLLVLVLVVLLGLGRAGHAELNAVRVDQKSHDASPRSDWLKPVRMLFPLNWLKPVHVKRVAQTGLNQQLDWLG